MDNPLDQTTLSTISLLESRLLRIEHLLYGAAASNPTSPTDSAAQRLRDLDRRFATLTSRVRVYGELLKIYKTNPDFFQPPDPAEPPSQLSFDAIEAIVLASASSFPATQSALTAIQDCPVPDPAESTSLIGLTDKMKGIEATQLAQAAEIAELRDRSEAIVRAWYQTGVVDSSKRLADVEGRVRGVERYIRRHERAREEEKAL